MKDLHVTNRRSQIGGGKGLPPLLLIESFKIMSNTYKKQCNTKLLCLKTRVVYCDVTERNRVAMSRHRHNVASHHHDGS
jgi:hypothetical protein